MDVAVLGMGRMGRAVAGRLLAGGHDVVVWNRSPGQAGDLINAGAREAATIAEAAGDRTVVITSLADDAAVRYVALGEQGVRPNIGADSVFVDSSTVSPALAGELDDSFPRFAAMPILGSPDAVATGRASYLLGCDPVIGDVLRPLLASLTATTVHFDHPPLALTAKLTNNLLLLSGVVALAEAATVGRAGGLTDDQIGELFARSPMVAPALGNRLEGVMTGYQKPWWTTVLGAKDARLAVGVAEQAGIDLPVARIVGDLYAEAGAAGYDQEDIIAVARRYQVHP